MDFGRDLVPHELVAVAVDEDDAEVDRTRAWINVPRPVVDAGIVLGAPARADEGRDADGDTGGEEAETPETGRFAAPVLPGSASVVWEAVDLPAPTAWTVELDGEELRDDDLDRFELPQVDPETIHFLTARLDFGDGIEARAHASFGGIHSDFVSTELTAVAVRRREEPRGRSEKLKDPGDLAGWFLDGKGREIPVVALDRRPRGSIVLVVDPAARESLPRLALVMDRRRRRVVVQRLGLDDRVLYLRPAARRVAGEHQLFDAFQPLVYSLADRRMDFVRVVTLAVQFVHAEGEGRSEDGEDHVVKLRQEDLRALQEGDEHRSGASPWQDTAASGPPRRLADAVAVAGMLAAEGRRARAVVLVVGAQGGESRLLPQQARGYLRALGVPLFVWRSVMPEVAKGGLAELPEWPDARPLIRAGDFIERVGELRDDLDTQRIVWLDGTHLHRNLSLSEEARAVVEWPAPPRSSQTTAE